MDSLLAWLFLSVIVERIVEVLVRLVPAIDQINIKHFNLKMLISFVFGGLFVWGANLDFFEMVNIQFELDYVGYVVSSIFVMAGSGYIADIVNMIGKSKETEIIVVEVAKEE